MGSESNRGVVDTLREVRDSGMENVAKATLAWTSSETYQRLNAALSKPAMLGVALFRRAREAAMSDLLAALNIPSRTDVLALSQRLTRIEMALDDVGAGMDEVRRGSAAKRNSVAPEHEGARKVRPVARSR
jgi:hypothetical protein